MKLTAHWPNDLEMLKVVHNRGVLFEPANQPAAGRYYPHG